MTLPAGRAPEWDRSGLWLWNSPAAPAKAPAETPIQDGGPDASNQAAPWIVWAHGAGAPMDSPFMDRMAALLAAEGYGVARFEFPYMQARRASGRRQPPDREPVLCESWRRAVETIQRRQAARAPLIIGGKSMGGRIASLIAESTAAAGLLCLGFPFHPAGRPERAAPRIAPLAALRIPVLILQGERDSLGNRAEVESYGLPSTCDVKWLPDGDHSFKPRVRSGRTLEQNLKLAARAAAAFAAKIRASIEGNS